MNQQQKGFHFDASKCVGCKACQMACKNKHNPVEGSNINMRRVYEYSGGGFTSDAEGILRSNVFAYYVSVGCNHCSEPVCVKACPTGACHKRREDGIVAIEQSVCIGCGSCARACPYDAPQMDNDKQVMTKCDGCLDFQRQGKKPVCVAACPANALDFGLMSDLESRHQDSSREGVAPLPQASITSPNLLVTGSSTTRPVGSTDGKFNNPREV